MKNIVSRTITMTCSFVVFFLGCSTFKNRDDSKLVIKRTPNRVETVEIISHFAAKIDEGMPLKDVKQVLHIFKCEMFNKSSGSIVSIFHSKGCGIRIVAEKEEKANYVVINTPEFYIKETVFYEPQTIKKDCVVYTFAVNNQKKWVQYRWSYVNYRLNGIIKEYTEDGDLFAEWLYEDGCLHGVSKCYFTNGNIKRIMCFTRSKRCGVWKDFTSTGKLIKSINYGKLQ